MASDRPGRPELRLRCRLLATATPLLSTWIDTPQALSERLARWAGQPLVALDTEFIRERTYYPQLALVQLAIPCEILLVDPLVPGMDAAMMQKVADLGIKRCTEDKWPAEATKCMIEAKAMADAQGCYAKLTQEQQGKMNKAAQELMMANAGSAAGSAAVGSADAAGSAAGSADPAGSAGSADAAGSAAGSAGRVEASLQFTRRGGEKPYVFVGEPPPGVPATRGEYEDRPVSITNARPFADRLDLDVEGSALTFAVVTPPAHGTLSGTAPNLTYTPDADFAGSDSFTFKVNDGALDSNVAAVSITVGAVNELYFLPLVGK